LKAEKKEGQILEVIRGWFRELENQLKLESEDCKDFIKKLMDEKQNKFVFFQKETLLMLEWYKRYANAFLDDTDTATNGED
ncbi:MAG TPA: type III-B CRISPR module-associated protein Cmr5, partial [Spirochaetales bacterium]|nr:type III-B CRISPR module-associated protein Cmr5 [Spirochaetales bacterium]